MHSNMLTAATILGGLGLFFFALHFLGQNLKLLAGQALRQRIARLTRNPAAGLATGTIMILITQSAAASVFVMVGLVRAGMMTLRQAQPVILGVSIGASLTVLFLTIDIRVAVMLLLGVSGILYAFGRPPAGRLAGAALGIALLFLGLQLMREGAAGLEGQDWFQSAVALTRGQPLLGFLIGAVLTVIAQSSVAVVVVMIAFQKAGLFGQAEAIMFVYGTNVGSSVLTYVLAGGLTGAARQVALYLVGFNFVAAVILVPLFYVETLLGLPLVAAAAQAVSADPGTQAALIYLIFNTAPVPLLLLGLGITERLLKRVAPETEVEQRARPKYLVGPLPDEAGIALRLVELEQARLIRLLISGLDALRAGAAPRALDDATEGFDTLAKSVQPAMDRIVSTANLRPEDYESVDAILRIQNNLEAVREALDGLSGALAHLRRAAPELRFPDAVVEGIDTILNVLDDVARGREPADIEMLLLMTSDDGNGARSVRSAYLAGEDAVAPADRVHLLAAANYCERLIWLAGEACRSYRALGSG